MHQHRSQHWWRILVGVPVARHVPVLERVTVGVPLRRPLRVGVGENEGVRVEESGEALSVCEHTAGGVQLVETVTARRQSSNTSEGPLRSPAPLHTTPPEATVTRSLESLEGKGCCRGCEEVVKAVTAEQSSGGHKMVTCAVGRSWGCRLAVSREGVAGRKTHCTDKTHATHRASTLCKRTLHSDHIHPARPTPLSNPCATTAHTSHFSCHQHDNMNQGRETTQCVCLCVCVCKRALYHQ